MAGGHRGRARFWRIDPQADYGQLNRIATNQQDRHPPDPRAVKVFHGRKGELPQPYREGQEEQLGALGLVVNCIVLYNTLYTQRIIEELRADRYHISHEDIRRLSPLVVEHVNLVGRYHIALAETILRGDYNR